MTTIKLIPLKKSTAAEISIPGSKSYTNRALLMAAMTKGTVVIKNPLLSDDTKAMILCLQILGIKILQKENEIEVQSDITTIKNRLYDLDADLSGITIRFILALATVIPGIKTIYGKEGLNKRPIGDLVDGLKQLGAKIDYLGKEGFPPLRVTSSRLSSGNIHMNGAISSQYFSAILMVAPFVKKLTITVDGEQISKPYIDMTIDTMKQFGITVNNKNYKSYTVPENQNYKIKEYTVEGDLSSASYFAAIAALTKSTITIKNINPDSAQADMRFFKILEKMGSKIMYGDNQITIKGHGIKAITVDMENCPDQAQTLAVLAAFANGVTKITGVQSLRVKETERVVAVQNELKKMGIKTTATKNTLTIFGGNPKAATINTYGDHRMAMSFSVAGTKLAGMMINDTDVVTKTFPNFWEKLHEIGVQTKIENNKNIILIGMRGSGKSTIAKLLAKKINKQFLDLDTLLVQKIGMTVPEIVAKHSWDYFRNQEAIIARKVANDTNCVIATGGGIILQNENIETLKKNGICIFLEAPIDVLVNRIGDDTNRVALTNKKSRKEEMEALWKQRKTLYKKAADITIDTQNINKTKVVETIMQYLKKEKYSL
ncbi:MAG TPA: 3-phosphoshikimate 1-carboxyvinyltransferase [Methylomirabilota bacterium]|nr:3-phosphoshikimate 1-carboxyvinyltransferase [Methylomirabilota bacterium]